MGIILIILYINSRNRQKIDYRGTILLFAFCNGFAYVFLKTPLWKVILFISDGIEWILSQASYPINLIFGSHNGYNLFVEGLLPLVYVNVLIGIAYHYNLIQNFINKVSIYIAKAFQICPVVTTNVFTNMFFSQNESILSIKNYLKNENNEVLFHTILSGMATFSAITIGLYRIGRETEYVLISIPLTALVTLLFGKILIPTDYHELYLMYDANLKGQTVGETIMIYAQKAWQVIINTCISLLAYMSLVNLLRNVFAYFNLDLDLILGYCFYPISYLLGIQSDEILIASEVLAQKVLYSGLVAFSSEKYQMLSYASKSILSTIMASFGSLGSLGMLIGVYYTICPTKISKITKYALLALIYANLVNIYTGALCSVFMN